jgi:hypothetical protein
MDQTYYYIFLFILSAKLNSAQILTQSSDDVLILPEAAYEAPPSIRIDRGARPLGVLGYYRCGAPEGFPGSCKPRATCASYYATTANYDYDRPDRYKSCNYGYGYRGVCCPDVLYTGRKPQVIKIHPVNRIGYNGRYVEISPAAIKKAVKWATEQINC